MKSWAAISGLAWQGHRTLVGVPDNAMPTAIYSIQVGRPYARVETLVPVTLHGEQARYDGEGIVVDTSMLARSDRGWWIASEGNADYGDEDYMPNLLVQVGADGEVLREVGLPESIDAPDGGLIRKNGFEGVAVSEDGRYLVAPIQRQFDGEEPTYTRIARLDLTTLEPVGGAGVRYTGDWEFFMYPLEPETTGGWIGLSELLCIGPQEYAVVERDKGIGGESTLKRVFVFSLAGLTDGATVSKSQWHDIVERFNPYEKVEGLAWSPESGLWIGLDNDGGEVESRLINLGW
jgi:hypothetical protein